MGWVFCRDVETKEKKREGGWMSKRTLTKVDPKKKKLEQIGGRLLVAAPVGKWEI